jgi:energy-coupling factor transporter ATP-binding protein EcfA2
MDVKFDLFLSYNRKDQKAVQAICNLLKLRGISTFRDGDQLTAGLPWPQALEQALMSTRAVGVFVGPRDFGLWQKREIYFALDLQVQAERETRQFPVIPLLLKDAQSRPGFLFLNSWIDFRDAADEVEALEKLIKAIKFDDKEPAGAPIDRCPYLGLRAFQEEDQAFYFGREAFVNLLVEKVAHQSIVAVIGPSGSGKSSVVLAGLLPQLRGRRSQPTWDAIIFRPGDNPWLSLALALLPFLEPDLSETGRIKEAGILARALSERNGALAATLRRVLELSLGTDRLLVVVDQFEEMFTLASVVTEDPTNGKPKERDHRLGVLDDLFAATKSTPVTVMLTLRADYYGHAVNASRELCNALNSGQQVTLGPLHRSELQQAIVGPAERAGLNFEPGLVNRMLDDVGDEPGRLPLLEYALKRLWDRRRNGRILTAEAYDGFRGVAGAISDQADSVYQALSEEERKAGRSLLGRLIRVTPEDTEGSDTRQRATRQIIGEEGWRIALKMATSDVRLLVVGHDSLTGQDTVEVAHEALIRSWKQLRDWVHEDRAFLLWRQQLSVFLSIWEASGERNQETLLRGPVLEEALKWRKSKYIDFNAREREFVATSEYAVRRGGRWSWIAAAVALAIAILAYAGHAFQRQYKDAARAYLQVTGGRVLQYTDEDRTVSFEVSLKNTGSTPASIDTDSVSLFVTAAGDVPAPAGRFDGKVDDLGKVGLRLAVPPKGNSVLRTLHCFCLGTTPRDEKIGLFAHLPYKDVFGEVHYLRWGWKLDLTDAFVVDDLPNNIGAFRIEEAYDSDSVEQVLKGVSSKGHSEPARKGVK